MGLDIEQLEALAFWDDRDAALAELVPGSVEQDYYRCVHLQLDGKLEEVDRVLGGWRKKHGHETELYQRLVHRQLLLRAGQDLASNATRLREETGAVLWHEAAAAAAAQRYPKRLDPALVSADAMLSRALQSAYDLSYVSDFGLTEVASDTLDANARRHLLQRVRRPGFPNIVRLVAEDLGESGSRGFGSLPAHTQLTLVELESLAVLRPELRQNLAWVNAVLTRLAPPAQADWQHDDEARRAHVARLWAFVEGLPPTFNGLKAHVLFHRLELDCRRGVFDRGLFLAYLDLPRRMPHVSTAWLQRFASEHQAQFGVAFPGTGLDALQNDADLVRRYLEHFLVSEDASAFAERFERAWLDEVLATTRLLNGDRDVEHWAGILGPSRVAALRERVEIDLAATNPRRIAREANVFLDVDIKNVPSLVVKVFRINTIAYFTGQNAAEVNTDIDLDGLVAHDELTLSFDTPPMRRVRRRIELPQCTRAGTYVVELIGNGKASRALLEKGTLLSTKRTSVAGLVLDVFDETGQHLSDAQVWFGGRSYDARADGSIVLPFSTRPGNVPILLVHGDVAVREVLSMPAEQYALAVGMHIEREALVAGKRATILVRPMLTVTGWPAPVALLEEPVLEITSTDLLGTPSRRSEPIVLHDDAESIVELQVPEDTVQLAITVRGKVRVVSTQSSQELSSGVTFSLNGIHQSMSIEAVHLASVAGGHVLHLLGKTGEARPNRALNVSLKHRVSNWELVTTLETDEQGRIELGALPGIERVTASSPTGARVFSLGLEDVPAPTVLHLLEGATLALPAPRQLGLDAEDRLPLWVSLVELRRNAPAFDLTHHVRYERSALVVSKLGAGEYLLTARGLRSPVSIVVMPSGRALQRGWARCTASSMLELSPAPAVLRGLDADDQELRIRVGHASPHSRVHVVATRFRAELASARTLERAPRRPSESHPRVVECAYVSGRDIGDEVRYVLERRKAKRRPGIMLERPTMLLNPWAIRSTSSQLQGVAAASTFGAAARGYAGAPAPKPAAPPAVGGTSSDASVDFLRASATVLANLRPDAAGEVRVARASLGDANHVRVILVDPTLTSTDELGLPETPLVPRDLSLRAPLPMAQHFTQDKRVQPLLAGHELVFEDRRAARLHLVDSVARTHQLLSTVVSSAQAARPSGPSTPPAHSELQTFSFVTRWHALDERERCKLYSKHACHELHLFLFFKDRPFFDRVIAPYLVNKRDKTFVDEFLLEHDLSKWLDPFRFGRLNTLEKILLGMRRPELRASIARFISDATDLLPQDPERDARLIDTLLGGSALEPGGGGMPPREPDMELLDDAEGAAPEEQEMARDEAPAKAKKRSRAGAPQTRTIATAMPPPPAAAPAFQAPARAAAAPPADFAGMGGFGNGGDLASVAMDMVSREQSEALYRGADKTEELAESDWWHVRRGAADAQLIPPNRFWRDLAQHTGSAPFLSAYLGECSTTFAEAMCALAVLDVPFVPGEHSFRTDDQRLVVTVASHALAARSSIVPVLHEPTQSDVLVAQSLFRADDRWEWDGTEQREKYVTGELSAGIVYACRVVVTNPSSSVQKLDLLVQIPERALVVSSGVATRTHHVRLQPYSTSSFEYAFYFPRSGSFSHFPPHVTRLGELVAFAEPKGLDVTTRPIVSDTASWSHISQHGSIDEVLSFLERANLGRVDLTHIAWRMRDQPAFERVLALLQARHVYSDTLWAYGLKHADVARTAEWLRHQALLDQIGPALEGGIVATHALERLRYEHLEYAPLVNARAHQLGARRKILNDALGDHYRELLEICAHQAHPSADARLAVAQIWFSLDRIDDASAMLARIGSEAAASINTQLQYDYLRAYEACCAGDLPRARKLATPHAAHDVDRWRHRFGALLAMVDEAEGKGPAEALDADSRDQRMNELAAKQPSVDLQVKRGMVVVVHDNVRRCELRFYTMDLELLFSREPFGKGDVERFSWIQPVETLSVELDGPSPTRVPIPAVLAHTNVVVEAVAVGARRSVAHYANDLDVRVYRRFGQLRVVKASTGAALPAAYVKVYGRSGSGAGTFFKDGYTDVRGRFDYATLSTDDLDRTTQFAILVLSESDGAAVVEAEPPTR